MSDFEMLHLVLMIIQIILELTKRDKDAKKEPPSSQVCGYFFK